MNFPPVQQTLRGASMNRHRRLAPQVLPVAAGAMLIGVLLVTAAMHAHGVEATGHENTTTGKVEALDHADMKNTRVRFEPGARTYWHTHAGGQVLVVQEGRGRMQQAGGPVIDMAPGQAIFTPPGVAHWHGAAPDHYVVLLSFYIGDVDW